MTGKRQVGAEPPDQWCEEKYLLWSFLGFNGNLLSEWFNRAPKPMRREFTVLVLDTFPLSLMTSWLPTRPGYYRVPAACWEKTKVIGSWISHESRLSIACKRGNWCLAVWCTTGLLAGSCCSLRLASCLAVWQPVCGSRHTLHILAHGSAGWVGI